MPRVLFGGKRLLGGARGEGAPRREFAVQRAKRSEGVVVLVRGGGASGVLFQTPAGFPVGGVHGGETRGFPSRVFRFDARAFVLARALCVCPRVGAPSVLVHEASRLLRRGVCDCLFRIPASLVLLRDTFLLRVVRRDCGGVRGDTARVFALATRIFSLGATRGVRLGAGATRFLVRPRALRFRVFARGVRVRGARHSLRFRPGPRLRGGEHLLRGLGFASALVLDDPRSYLPLRGSAHRSLRGASTLILLASVLLLELHLVLRRGERGEPSFLFLFP